MTNNQRPQCGYCGPGYRIGDEGCGHSEFFAIRPAVVHLEPIPPPAGTAHTEPGFTFELEEVTCEACKAGVVGAVRAQRPAGRQVWERRLVGTDIAENRIHLDVDQDGRARVHESILLQLLVDAGWERTA